MSINVVCGDDNFIDDFEKFCVDKEVDVFSQMYMFVWYVVVIKQFNGGRFVFVFVGKCFVCQFIFVFGIGSNGFFCDWVRIFDFGGQGVCDWVWYVVFQFFNCKIYIVIIKVIC